MTAQRHYEALLGEVYQWSTTARGDAFERGRAWLADTGLDRGQSYLDLGAGFGTHVVPLVRAGKQVEAVDFDATLLEQLDRALGADRRRVSVHEEDIVSFLRRTAGSRWDVILCAGDTLTHLPDANSARELVGLCADRLEAGGALAIEYRDSTQFAADGVRRFIEVARDSRRIMHCLLEPLGPDTLRVTDIVTDVTADGPRTRISAYEKLRLSPDQIEAWAHSVGLRTDRHCSAAGMTTLVFRNDVRHH